MTDGRRLHCGRVLRLDPPRPAAAIEPLDVPLADLRKAHPQ